MIKKGILAGILTLFIHSVYGQSQTCDSVINYSRAQYYTDFDLQFQEEYDAIIADSILVFHHEYGYFNSLRFALFCWKKEGEFYFRMLRSTKKKIKSSSKLKKKLRTHLISFFEKKIFTHTGEVPNQYWIDDGASTMVLFKSKDDCWRLYHCIGGAKDVRVIWLNEVREIMK